MNPPQLFNSQRHQKLLPIAEVGCDTAFEHSISEQVIPPQSNPEIIRYLLIIQVELPRCGESILEV